MKILHVDDEEALLEQTKIFLRKEDENFDIDPVSSSKEALDRLKEEEYDIIVSDYQMPGIDGLEFLKIIREDMGSDIPFIIFTGKGREEVAIEALNLGANRYIRKGGEPRSQYELLSRAIKREVEIHLSDKQLKKNEKELKTILENTPLPIFIVDGEGRIYRSNTATGEFADKNKHKIIDERVGKALRCIHFVNHSEGCGYTPYCDKCPIRQTFLETFNTGEDFYRKEIEHPFLENDNGDPMYFWMSTALLRLEDKKRVLIILEDITEKKEKIKKIRFQSNLLEHVEDGVIATDLEGKITYWNDKAEELYGWKEEEVLGKNIVDVTPSLTSKEQAQEIMESLRKGEKWSDEFMVKDRYGNEFPAIVTDAPIYDEDGEMIGIVGVSTDISKQKELEEREQFLHSLLRHNLKNKSQIIRGFLELLMEEELSDEGEEYLSKAKSTVKESVELIEKVRTLNRLKDKEGSVRMNLPELMNELVHTYSTSDDGLDIKIQCDNHECEVLGKSLLKEAFSNLIENAIKHAGCSTIRITGEDKDEYIGCTIEDDGRGIPDEMKEEIFDKGFKRGEESGSGLGLFLVKEIIEESGGSIEVNDSELGGARFDVLLKKA